jgi:hypothetical protein
MALDAFVLVGLSGLQHFLETGGLRKFKGLHF